MRVIPRPDIASQTLAEGMVRSNEGYVSEGNAVVNLKSLMYCLTAEWLKQQAKKTGLDLGPLTAYDQVPQTQDEAATLLQILTGVGLERLLFSAPGPRVELQTPFGIASGRIDHLDEDGVPWELKVTWASNKKDPIDDNPQYVEQLASYGASLNKPVGRLYVVNIAGSRQQWDMRPTLRVDDLEWSDREMSGFKDELFRRTAVVTGDQIPSVVEHQKWECARCKLKDGCPYPGKKGREFGFFSRDVAGVPRTDLKVQRKFRLPRRDGGV